MRVGSRGSDSLLSGIWVWGRARRPHVRTDEAHTAKLADSVFRGRLSGLEPQGHNLAGTDRHAHLASLHL